ncbi:MAG: galactose-1-phosphate uridylyltransferase [Candidatus Parvarchaeum sp.]
MSEIPFKGEIRKDYITGSDVIFTFSRDKRPKDFKSEEIMYGNKENCPFEYGKESLNTTIKLIEDPWKLRLMYNKYPIVNEDIAPYNENPGFFTRYANYGHSYVIVDTPDHLQKFYEIEDSLLQKWFKLVAEAEKRAYSDSNIKQVYTFRNNGSISGGSLYHPHTQIIGFTFVLPIIKQELDIIKKNRGNCILEEAMKKEKERILIEDEKAIAFAPYGSRFKGQSIIMPKRHIDYVGRLEEEETISLARFIKEILRKNNILFGSHSYNIIFHELKDNKKLHFYIEIAPRFSNFGAMELSGLYLNSLRPEEYVQRFNETV